MMLNHRKPYPTPYIHKHNYLIIFAHVLPRLDVLETYKAWRESPLIICARTSWEEFPSLSSYKCIRLKVGWITPLNIHFLLKDKTLVSELQDLVCWCFRCWYLSIVHHLCFKCARQLKYFTKERNDLVALWSIRNRVLFLLFEDRREGRLR